MIDVGIQDNIKIASAELRADPKGDSMKAALVVALEVTGDTEEDLMGSLMGAEENVQDGNDQEYYFWPIDTKGKDGTDVDLKEVLKRIKDFKAQLNHILSGYMVKATIEAKWSTMFQGTGVTPENAEQTLIQPEPLNKVYKSIVNGFLELLTPFIGPTAASVPLFRVKLIRRNAEKHFSNIPRFAPFWEPMSVTKDQSKLAFTKWEKEKGYDSGTPSPDAPAPDSQPDAAEQAAVDNVFGLADGNAIT